LSTHFTFRKGQIRELRYFIITLLRWASFLQVVINGFLVQGRQGDLRRIGHLVAADRVKPESTSCVSFQSDFQGFEAALVKQGVARRRSGAGVGAGGAAAATVFFMEASSWGVKQRRGLGG